jgi:DNA mismatch endonuclease (patch repair protein)
MGLRFRLHRKDIPGTPDIVLPRWRTAIFVHGCFWHGCDRCDRGTRVPKTNTEFWTTKIRQNRERDNRKTAMLREMGWRVSVIWQCDLEDQAMLAERLESLFSSGKQS